MEWIKRNPHFAALAGFAFVLLGVSAWVAVAAHGFPAKFSNLENRPAHSSKLPEADISPITAAEARLASPAKWIGRPLFVPEPYVVRDGEPQKVIVASFYVDSLTKQPIPNAWFLENKLSLTDPKIQFEDPDKDGFSNEDEFRGGTDPNDKEKHPPYYTKLFLRQYKRVQFRLLFQAVDGDPKSPLGFQINAVDNNRRTEFLKLGDKVSNSPYQLKSYEYKTALNTSTGDQEDASELTVINLETQDIVVLPIGKTTDSPESFAIFVYEWPDIQKPMRIEVKKLQSFFLLPDKDPVKDLYKLLDIKETEALIQTPTGEKQQISSDPRLSSGAQK